MWRPRVFAGILSHQKGNTSSRSCGSIFLNNVWTQPRENGCLSWWNHNFIWFHGNPSEMNDLMSGVGWIHHVCFPWTFKHITANKWYVKYIHLSTHLNYSWYVNHPPVINHGVLARKITDFYGPFSSTPCLFSEGYTVHIHMNINLIGYSDLTRYCQYSITMTDWWFGAFFIFPYIGNVIIPIDELIFFRGVCSTTNQITMVNSPMELPLTIGSLFLGGEASQAAGRRRAAGPQWPWYLWCFYGKIPDIYLVYHISDFRYLEVIWYFWVDDG